jgi:hypothetical protein
MICMFRAECKGKIMKTLSLILGMIVMLTAGCGAQTSSASAPSAAQTSSASAPSAAQTSSASAPSAAQTSPSQVQTANGAEEEKDAARMPEADTSADTETVLDTPADEAITETAEASTAAAGEESQSADNKTKGEENTMRLLIGEREVPVAWEENESVKALQDLCPLTIRMSMYGGFEQVGSIGQSIVREDVETVTDSGDIVLYSGNQIVIFYGSNSWAYTRLGHIDLSEQEMRDLLSGGDVTITLEK